MTPKTLSVVSLVQSPCVGKIPNGARKFVPSCGNSSSGVRETVSLRSAVLPGSTPAQSWPGGQTSPKEPVRPLPNSSRGSASRSFAPAGIRETAALTLFRNLCRLGYSVVPVNPTAKETDGVLRYECVQELDPPVDTALVMTSADPAATVGRKALPVGVRAGVERALDVSTCDQGTCRWRTRSLDGDVLNRIQTLRIEIGMVVACIGAPKVVSISRNADRHRRNKRTGPQRLPGLLPGLRLVVLPACQDGR